MRCLRLNPALAALAAAAPLALGACVLSGDDTPPPAIAAIVPPTAGAGQTVSVEGDHFCPTVGDPDAGAASCDAAGGLIRFGATGASTTDWNDTAIDAVVPPLSPGTYSVVIAVGGRTSNSESFTVTP